MVNEELSDQNTAYVMRICMRIWEFGACLGYEVMCGVYGMTNLPSELVSISGVHFGPERIGEGLCLRFKACSRSLLQEVIIKRG
jgi:hypothetical protein